MPKRPLQHRLEDESRKAFEGALPSRLVYRSIHPDYGIDGEVEEFDKESDKATGIRFLVQLKATSKQGPTAMRERISLDSAAYYRAQHSPVLMVRYLATTSQLYGRWFHEFDPYYEHVGDSHLTFHWSDENLIHPETIDRLVTEAGRIAKLKDVKLKLPLSATFDVPIEGVYGLAQAELDLALDSAFANCPRVLERSQQQDADLKVVIRDDEIRADLSGLSSVTFHLENEIYTGGAPFEAIGSDVLSCIAMALARAGHGEPAARIAVKSLPDSLFSGLPPLTAELFGAMAEAGRVMEVLDVVDQLDSSGEKTKEASAATFMTSIWPIRDSLQPYEHHHLEKLLRSRFHRRVEEGRSEDAAASAENLGRYLMGVGRQVEAAEFLNRAIELDSGRETEEIAQLRAGAYFLSQQYPESVAAYERALEISQDPDPHLEARHADALLFAGRYKEALAAFEEIEGGDIGVGTWIYTKMRAVSWVLSATGFEQQERDHKASEDLAGQWEGLDPEDADALADRVWELDAVSPLGWFNRGRDFLNKDLQEEAMHAYLTAAVMHEGDVEAWVNVAILAGQLGDVHLFGASAITGHRLNRERYLGEFARQLRVSVDEPTTREALLTAVKETVSES